MISHCYYPSTIDESYEGAHQSEPVPEMKDVNGNWNVSGHPRRVVKIGKDELASIAKVYDDPEAPQSTRLPVIYAVDLLGVIERYAEQKVKIADFIGKTDVYMTQLLDETASQSNHVISEGSHFPEDDYYFVYCGPYISISNPLFKTPRRECSEKADYDKVDLQMINSSYIQRSKYSIEEIMMDYLSDSPRTEKNTRYIDTYRIATRKMLGLNQERTLMSAIIPPKTSHINGIYGMYLEDGNLLVFIQGLMSSLPYDYLIRSLGKSNFLDDTAYKIPVIETNRRGAIVLRALMLNCVSERYQDLWEKCWDQSFCLDSWSREDNKLSRGIFKSLSPAWSSSTFLKSDYERRWALIETDVLVAQSLGMDLEQLLTVYRIQFPVLKKYEEDTWYDYNGRIVFTNNRSLTGVGFDRKEWENGIKGASTGQKFYRTITDDTIPGGPMERTIEYVAPFDRCDREKDYETAWKFFEDKYGKEK